jgi:hypothetical protein
MEVIFICKTSLLFRIRDHLMLKLIRLNKKNIILKDVLSVCMFMIVYIR